MKKLDRKEILLKAAYDLLKKCDDSFYVLDALTTTVFMMMLNAMEVA